MISSQRRIFAITTVLAALMLGCEARAKGPVRQPAVAGSFYPHDANELTRMIDVFLAEAETPALPGRVRALIVPHAGYVYSGAVAAHAIKAIQGRQFNRIVLVGNSHQEGFEGARVYSRGSWRTPFGEVAIDVEAARKLVGASELVSAGESIHEGEHSLEVIVPFLQRALGEFKLVPVLLGSASRAASSVLASAIGRILDDETLIVASTDMSHYPNYEDAVFADRKVAGAIATGDVGELERTIRHLHRVGMAGASTFLCAEGAVKAVMAAAKEAGADDVRVLKYANSGDSGGRKDRVVGYCAVSFAAKEGAIMSNEESEHEELTDAEQKELLGLARVTVESIVKSGRMPVYKNALPALEQKLGAFVTLKKRGDLRGCIGRFQPDIPLYRVVMEMAVQAATQDPRFKPVTESELDDVDFEISVLSPLRKVDWREIEVGKHGVQVVRGFRSGVFLPQVATENNWDLDTFMSYLCRHKAGLPADAWKDPETTLLVFTAQVFGEQPQE